MTAETVTEALTVCGQRDAQRDGERYAAPAIASSSTSTSGLSDAFEGEVTLILESPPSDSSARKPSGSGAPLALRTYQLQSLEQVESAQERRVLVVLPTGAGKTVVAAELIRREVNRGGRALFLAPRRELVMQACAKLAEVRHGLLLAGAGGQDIYASVQVGSVDTLMSRAIRRRSLVLPGVSLVVIDEAHIGLTKARMTLLDLWPGARLIGLTATPTRRDGRPLGLLFDAMIETATTASLMAAGHLCKARYFTVSEPDLRRVRTVAGEYNAEDLDQAVNRVELVADVVSTWLARAAARRTVVFATSIAHSAHLAERFMRAGVAAEHVDANTPALMRDQIFERFRSGRTQVLTNCNLASYGFDLPELDCIVLARPTKSLALFLQMIGRGLRVAPGKADCLVLDHSGAVRRHGFAHDARKWTLEGEAALVDTPKAARERRESRLLVCPECSAAFAGARLCPECGYFFAPIGREVETLDGNLVEIGEHMADSDQERLAFFLELRGYGIERRFKPGWPAVNFLKKFGMWPPRSWNDYPPTKPSFPTRRWAQSRLIAWHKAREGSTA